MLKSLFCSFLILLSSIIIETSILSNISFLPAVPDLLLICSVYISLVNGKTYGIVTGFASGLLLDFISGSPLGFNCIFRTIIGYIFVAFGKSFNYTGFVIPCIIGCVATFIKVFLIWVISLFFKSIEVYNIFSLTFLFELIFNSLLTPLIFKFLKSFKGILSINS